MKARLEATWATAARATRRARRGPDTAPLDRPPAFDTSREVNLNDLVTAGVLEEEIAEDLTVAYLMNPFAGAVLTRPSRS